jgi:hypothetical protein
MEMNDSTILLERCIRILAQTKRLGDILCMRACIPIHFHTDLWVNALLGTGSGKFDRKNLAGVDGPL